jgi:hypothetical protein
MFPVMKYDIARMVSKDAGILLTALYQFMSDAVRSPIHSSLAFNV